MKCVTQCGVLLCFAGSSQHRNLSHDASEVGVKAGVVETTRRVLRRERGGSLSICLFVPYLEGSLSLSRFPWKRHSYTRIHTTTTCRALCPGERGRKVRRGARDNGEWAMARRGRGLFSYTHAREERRGHSAIHLHRLFQFLEVTPGPGGHAGLPPHKQKTTDHMANLTASPPDDHHAFRSSLCGRITDGRRRTWSCPCSSPGASRCWCRGASSLRSPTSQ